MSVAIVGLVMLAFGLAARISSARSLRNESHPTVMWRYVAQSPNIWIGLSLVLYAISPIAGSALFVIAIVAWMVQVFRDVRASVSAKKALR